MEENQVTEFVADILNEMDYNEIKIKPGDVPQFAIIIKSMLSSYGLTN